MPTPKPTRSLDRETIRIFTKAVLAHPKTAALSLLNPFGAVFMSVLVPYFASGALARLARHDPHAQGYIAYMAVAALIGVTLNRVGFTRLMILQAEVMSNLHERIFTRLLQRSTGYHTNQISGKLVSDAIDFVSAFSAMLVAVFINGAPFVFIIIAGLTVVLVTSLPLGLYILGVVALTLTWAYFESRTRYELRNNRLIASKNLTSHLSDAIVNAQTVKTFARENTENQRNRKLNHILLDLRITDWQRAGRSGNDRIAALLIMQVLLLVLVSYLSGNSTDVLATGFFAFTYVFTITMKLFDINAMTRQVEESFLQASPMTQMLLGDVEIVDQPDAQALSVPKGAISFTGVHFHYEDTSRDQTVFAGLDLTITPGERIGLVGPSGGGKSTLTRLLLRFEDIDSGTISIDGQDITAVTQTSLRQAVSYVPQEPLLFHRSVSENIAYGKPGATESEIIAAADKAHAVEFIDKLPHGFNTIVGERGVKLSGGQRQRVAIARAILKDAPILVLDEATSALDSESEVMIQKALWELMKDRTAIVIAHRLSTIQKMDRIIVLDDGKITEQGSHSQLQQRHGLYATLWNHQTGGFIK